MHLLCFATLFVLSCVVSADESSHSYSSGEHVVVWANKVGPYNNPQETYGYYSLPYCRTEEPGRDLLVKWDNLGSILEGNDLEDSGIPLKFGVDVEKETLCTVEMIDAKRIAFREAVESKYWYQLYIDDLPVWGMVGQYKEDNQKEMNEEKKDVQIYTHQSFLISYNDDRIIEVNLSTEAVVSLSQETQSIPFTYSVHWIQTQKSFAKRFDKYLDSSFFEHQIHWFSVFNSFMMVIFLCGLVALIFMRTLRNDITKYSLEDDELDLSRIVEESGWKQIHGDVFRQPPYLAPLAALIGSGHQIAIIFLCIALYAFAGSLYIWRGAILNSFITLFTVTSFVAGYSSGSFYKRYGGKHWKSAFLFTSLLFPGIGIGVIIALNFVALAYSSTASIPFLSMLKILFLWVLISCPLNFIGTIYGRASTNKGDFPCRVTNLPRPILNRKWYSQRLFLALAGGLLPFGCIFIEMYFIFTSFWNYKFYYVYGFMLLVFIILLIVIMCVNIVSTYFLLSAEDYRWQWTSFCSGASISIYILLYSLYYYHHKTDMTGFFQGTYYFSYMTVVCATFGVMAGSFAFTTSHLFVWKIYQNIKSD